MGIMTLLLTIVLSLVGPPLLLEAVVGLWNKCEYTLMSKSTSIKLVSVFLLAVTLLLCDSGIINSPDIVYLSMPILIAVLTFPRLRLGYSWHLNMLGWFILNGWLIATFLDALGITHFWESLDTDILTMNTNI